VTALELVEEFWRTWREGPREAMLERYDELFTPDYEWHPPAVAVTGAYVGRDGFERYWEEMGEVWDEFGVEVEELLVVGEEAVLTRGRVRTRGAGSGVDLDRPMYVLSRVRDGRISWSRAVFEADEAKQLVAEIGGSWEGGP
jgi:ketosteroid isomerase-like protein